jgi:hypothetical protein
MISSGPQHEYSFDRSLKCPITRRPVCSKIPVPFYTYNHIKPQILRLYTHVPSTVDAVYIVISSAAGWSPGSIKPWMINLVKSEQYTGMNAVSIHD